jgi:hypothetical protein
MSVLRDWPAEGPKVNTFFVRSIFRSGGFLYTAAVCLAVTVFNVVVLIQMKGSSSNVFFQLVGVVACFGWAPMYGAYRQHSKINELYLSNRIVGVEPDSALNELLQVAEAGVVQTMAAGSSIYVVLSLIAARASHYLH